jgi:hypothetical protein
MDTDDLPYRECTLCDRIMKTSVMPEIVRQSDYLSLSVPEGRRLLWRLLTTAQLYITVILGRVYKVNSVTNYYKHLASCIKHKRTSE